MKVNKMTKKYSSNNPHPITKFVGDKLRQRMLEKGVTQKELGEYCGVTFQQIQKNLYGSNRIGSERLYDISKYLGVSVAYFFPDDTVEEIKTSNESLKLIAKLEKLDEETRKNLVSVFRTMINKTTR